MFFLQNLTNSKNCFNKRDNITICFKIRQNCEIIKNQILKFRNDKATFVIALNEIPEA